MENIHHSYLQSPQPPNPKHCGFDMYFYSRSRGEPSGGLPQDTQSEKPTSVNPAPPPVTPVSILKTSTSGASSKRKLIRELFEVLSEPRKEWWRSSQELFASASESENEESPLKMTRKTPKKDVSWVSNTPSHRTKSTPCSGVWSNDSSNDDDDDGELGWDQWPRDPPLE
nr:MAG: ORF3 [Torque teno polar bear virus 45]